MVAVTADIASRIADLSDAAFTAFCDDVGGMFGVDMQCTRREAHVTAVRNVREHFKKLSVVHLTKADGVLEGTFHLAFDQGGLFILSGVVVMLPESRILEEAKRGTLEDATNMQDAAREVGNLLVGSWDRVFRENCRGHAHFVKTSTFLGKPWDKPEQMELEAETQVVLVRYDMSIDPYPSFTCAVVFPLAVLKGLDGTKEPEDAPIEPASAPRPETPAPSPTSAAPSPNIPPPEPAQPAVAAVKPAPEAPPVPPTIPTPVEDEAWKGKVIPPARRSPAIDAGMLPSELASAESGGAARGAGYAFLDEAYIRSHPQAGSVPAESAVSLLLSRPVAAIMDKDVVWAGPEDTVQDVIAKMQQHNVGYILIGSNGTLEGLVSNSNILGAVSLYLRPMFAKWRRAQDDATLGVKVKWIMSRPVRTVRPDATLAAVIESMRRCGGRCLPVVDAQGTVQGLVTALGLLLHVLESDESTSWKGRPPQAPALMI